jgi:hypothetical protein
VLRGTIIQNHAAAMANMKELSAGFKQFWEQQPGDDPIERFREFGVSLPDNFVVQVQQMLSTTEPEVAGLLVHDTWSGMLGEAIHGCHPC